MSKHTPGEWKLRSGPGGQAVSAIVNGAETVITLMSPMPCIGGHDDLAAERGMDMEQANARLIAAAPELLAALDDCVEALAHLQDRLGVRVNPPTLDRARAAIAKATAPISPSPD